MKTIIAISMLLLMLTSCRIGSTSSIELQRAKMSTDGGFTYIPSARKINCKVTQIKETNSARKLTHGIQEKDVIVYGISEDGKTYRFKHTLIDGANVSRLSKKLKVGDDIQLVLNKDGKIEYIIN